MPADADDKATPQTPDSPSGTPDAPATGEPGVYVPAGPEDESALAKTEDAPAKEGELLDAQGRPVNADGEPTDKPLPEFEGWMGDAVNFLSESALGRGLIRGGQWVWDHSTMVVFVLLAVAVLTWTLRLRQRSDVEATIAARDGLFQLEQVVGQMEQLRFQANPLTNPLANADELADAVARGRDALSNASVATRGADDPIVARSLRLQGDFHWLVATLPPAGIPSTRPAEERPEAPDVAASLAEAKAAYERVASDFPQQRNEVRVARFSLAAVAEEEGDFDAARAQYDALLADDSLPEAQKRHAENRRALLDEFATNSRLARGLVDQPSGRGADSMDAITRDLNELAGDGFDGLDLGELNRPATEPTTQPSSD